MALMLIYINDHILVTTTDIKLVETIPILQRVVMVDEVLQVKVDVQLAKEEALVRAAAAAALVVLPDTHLVKKRDLISLMAAEEETEKLMHV